MGFAPTLFTTNHVTTYLNIWCDMNTMCEHSVLTVLHPITWLLCLCSFISLTQVTTALPHYLRLTVIYTSQSNNMYYICKSCKAWLLNEWIQYVLSYLVEYIHNIIISPLGLLTCDFLCSAMNLTLFVFNYQVRLTVISWWVRTIEQSLATSRL